MRYSFLVLDRAFGSGKILFCKVDCHDHEYALLKQGKMLDRAIYERDRNSEVIPIVKKAISAFLFSSSSREKDRKRGEAMRHRYRSAYALRDVIAGVGIPVTAYDVPKVESFIEARLVDIGQTLNLAISRNSAFGRSHDI